jgi:hypothetical protein
MCAAVQQSFHNLTCSRVTEEPPCIDFRFQTHYHYAMKTLNARHAEQIESLIAKHTAETEAQKTKYNEEITYLRASRDSAKKRFVIIKNHFDDLLDKNTAEVSAKCLAALKERQFRDRERRSARILFILSILFSIFISAIITRLYFSPAVCR